MKASLLLKLLISLTEVRKSNCAPRVKASGSAKWNFKNKGTDA
jgi:hypothetical protein